MSRVLPILFNMEMVRAILNGRKTCTRRLVKLPSYIKQQEDGLYTLWAEGTCYENQYLEEIIEYIKTPYQPGDILYVRETWFYENHMENKTAGEPDLPSGRYKNRYIYRADNPDYPVNIGVGAYGWHPSIHMPKEAARIWLKVNDIRVERLQEITDEQVKREGIQYDECPTGFTWKQETYMHNCYTTPIGAMQALWNSTIKKSDLDRYGWNANPWVWVIEFERCNKPKEESEK